jgi:N-hydroxyarylamine O-acetyltransferase
VIDLDAYFKRIGYHGERKPTLAVLRELHRLHPQAIAFENLDPLLGRPVPIDPQSLQRKMIGQGRGGYCYEQNMLFAAVLRSLGFKFRELTGWPRWALPGGVTLPRTHLLLLLDIEGEEWIADVGFGGNTLTGPLKLRETATQTTPHEPARVAAANGGFVIQVQANEKWGDLIAFDLGAQSPADLDMGNWYTSTHPNSRFKRELLAARAEEGRRYGLRNNELVEHKADAASARRKLGSAAELRDAYGDVFHVKLPDDPSLNSLLSRFAEGAP